MQTYLERYLSGEHIGVWAELVGLGPAVRDEPVFSDAHAVAQEMMMRAKHNIEVLIERLNQLEYRFLLPDQVWVPPDEDAVRALDGLDHRYGPFPLAIRKWYEIVGRVDFLGIHPKLSHYDGPIWSDSGKVAYYSDPMVVYRPRGEMVLSYYINQAADWDEMAKMEEENPPPYGIDFGMSAINKANHSGCGAVQILVPNPAFDSPIIDWDDYWMGTFFVPYLRACFQWGGFPGFSQVEESDIPKEELDFLTNGLLNL